MQHGVKNYEVTAPRSRFYQGGFGRLFPDLDPWVPTRADGRPPASSTELEELAIGIANSWMRETDEAGAADSIMPAAYTFFGQFIDHDITLDTTPLSSADIDPNRLHNFRTPRLDLDCLYGQGPDAQPFLYEGDKARFRIGRALTSGTDELSDAPDLPRHSTSGPAQTALIGDPRNDENALVAQVHLAFLRAHNALVNEAVRQQKGNGFEAARRTLTWLYQWIVWHDFTKRICDRLVFEEALTAVEHKGRGHTWEAGYEDIYNWKDCPFMPLEFSVAAFRFGHTLVRPGYRTNGTLGFPTFAAEGTASLRGFRALETDRILDWDFFLERDGADASQVQHSRRFDQFLAPALSRLPEDPMAPTDPAKILNVLAARNLARAVRLDLPSGSGVARALGLPVKAPDTARNEPDALWYYLLKESGLPADQGGADGNHLGALGSILVASTIAGLLLGDPLSHLRRQPTWTPNDDNLLAALNSDGGITRDSKEGWTLAAIIRLAERDGSGEAMGAAAAG